MAACLICCPADAIPEDLRAFLLGLRADYPADTIARAAGRVGADILPALAGIETCWNCRGRGVVTR